MNKILNLIVIIYSVQSFSWQESFGGDPAIADFKYKAFEFINFAYKQGTLNPFHQDKKTLNQQFDGIQFSCKENLNVNNSQVLAINYPYANPKKIELDCSAYTQLSETDKANLVIHETLSVFEILDIDYRQSFKFSSDFKEYLLGLRLVHQNFINYIEECDLNKFSKINELGHHINFVHNNNSALEYAIAYSCTDIFDYLIKNGAELPFRSNLLIDKSRENHIAFALAQIALDEYLIFLDKDTDFLKRRLSMVKKLIDLNPEFNKVKYSYHFYFQYKFDHELDWNSEITMESFFRSINYLIIPYYSKPATSKEDIDYFKSTLSYILKN